MRLWLVLAFLLATSCTGFGPTFASDPRVVSRADSRAPLAFELVVWTSQPTSLRCEITAEGKVENTISYPGVRSSHRVALAGLKPGRNYDVAIIVRDERGRESRFPQPLKVTTPPLPADFPKILVPVSQPQSMEPGVTLFNLNAAPGGNPSYLVAVDARGDVVWYYRSEYRAMDVRRMRNGNFLFLGATGSIQDHAIEIDLLGDTIRRWHASGTGRPSPTGSTAVATDSFHHEIFEMPSDSFLVLSSALRTVEQFPTSDKDPRAPRKTATVVDDVVVEFKADGTIVKQWSMLDLLDAHRIGFGSLGQGWNQTYEKAGTPTNDWAHGNAVIWSPSDDSIIVSLYTQDAVVKFSRATGKLIWILGNPDGWDAKLKPFLLQPAGTPFEWQYHQHSPEITPTGTLLLFDNGTFRARPFAPSMPADASYSRAVEYRIDEANRKIVQVWTYGGPGDEIFFSRPFGDADWMPKSGNILVTDGGRATDAQGRASSDFTKDNVWSRIVEVTHTSPAKKVFELVVRVPMQEGRSGWYIYRAERLPSLLP